MRSSHQRRSGGDSLSRPRIAPAASVPVRDENISDYIVFESSCRPVETRVLLDSEVPGRASENINDLRVQPELLSTCRNVANLLHGVSVDLSKAPVDDLSTTCRKSTGRQVDWLRKFSETPVDLSKTSKLSFWLGQKPQNQVFGQKQADFSTGDLSTSTGEVSTTFFNIFKNLADSSTGRHLLPNKPMILAPKYLPLGDLSVEASKIDRVANVSISEFGGAR